MICQQRLGIQHSMVNCAMRYKGSSPYLFALFGQEVGRMVLVSEGRKVQAYRTGRDSTVCTPLRSNKKLFPIIETFWQFSVLL